VQISRQKGSGANYTGDGPPPASIPLMVNGLYARILPGLTPPIPIVTHSKDQSDVGKVLIELNNQNLHLNPIFQQDLDRILKIPCHFRLISRAQYDQQFKASVLGFEASYPLLHRNRSTHAVVKTVMPSISEKYGIVNGDILWKINNIETSTLTDDDLQRLMQQTTIEKFIFMPQRKYLLMMARRKLFKSIPQEWDFENRCPHCSYVYLKGNC
jgi:hypothetical protein